MNATTWFGRRGDFNHQWLSNNYLLQLRVWIADLESGDEQTDSRFEGKFIKHILPQWEERATEARKIVDEAESSLSPAKLFCRPPLHRLPTNIREPLAGACHQLWMVRTQDFRDRASRAVKEVDVAYKQLSHALAWCPIPLTPESTQHCLPLAKQFEQTCKELKAVMEVLPRIAKW